MLQLKSLNHWLFLLQLKLRQLLIRVGRYPCGSLDVHISSAGMAITDKRHMPQMPRHLSILTITPDNTDPAKSASDVFAPWDTVRGFVNHNVSMPDFSRLTHRSSFERRHSIKRVQSGISPLLRHRVTSDDQEPAGELSLLGAEAIRQCHEPTDCTVDDGLHRLLLCAHLITASYDAYGCTARSVLSHAALLLGIQLTCLHTAFCHMLHFW